MFREEIQKLTQRIEYIENRFDEFDIKEVGGEEYEGLEAEVYEIEKEIADYLGGAEGIQYEQLRKLQKTVSRIKSENDFYDKEAELDRMFPNRYDDDFDEDSMSYDSVFGGD
jgi:hypothetical protein